MEHGVERGPDWAGLPVIATLARLLCPELTLQNEYLRLENRILKEKVSGRIRLSLSRARGTGLTGLISLLRGLLRDFPKLCSGFAVGATR